MKTLHSSIIIFGILALIVVLSTTEVSAQIRSSNNLHQNHAVSMPGISNDYLDIAPSPFWAVQPPQNPLNDAIFTITAISVDNGKVQSLSLALRPELKDFYKEVGVFGQKSQNTVFVYPIFTQAAYSENGFYAYYKKNCGSECLTVSIPTKIEGEYTSSIGAALALGLLGFPHITDIDIDKNPDILKKYDRIILLHNEYVTSKEFQAITSHPNVVYLFPNALHAEVNANYDTNTITLIRGHGYPTASLNNGFDWKYDNTRFEYDNQCINWKFYTIDNGIMLNCYPDNAILYDSSMIRALHEGDQGDLKVDTTEWVGNSTEIISNHELLGDAGIEANFVPHWFVKLGYWFANGKISQNEFVDTIKYLYDIHILR
jgi:hypothetical protein